MLDPTMSDYEQVQRVTEKLRPEFVSSVVEKDPQDINTLRDICRRVEAAKDLQRITYSNSNNTMQSKSKTFRPRQKFDNNNQDKKEDDKKKCHRCGRTSHLKRNCHARKHLNGDELKDSPPAKFPAKTVNLVEVQDNEEESKVITNIDTIIATNDTNQSNDNWLWIDIKCNDSKCKAVIDSGAQKSVMSIETAKKHNWKINNRKINLLGPNKSSIEVVGSLVLDTKLKIGSIEKQKKHRWYITSSLAAPMLFGADLIVDFDLIPDQKRGRVMFYSKPGFHVLRDSKVPSRSQTLITTLVDATGLIMAIPFGNDLDVSIANCVIVPKDGTAQLLVANPNTYDVILKQNTKLADYNHLENDSGELYLMPTKIGLPESDQLIRIGSDLTSIQFSELESLLARYKDAFSLQGEIGCAKRLQHSIELIDGAKPFIEPTRRRPRAHIDEANRQTQEMLKAGVIEPSNSPWSSAYVVVKKKTGDFRICIDFRKLNDLTKKDAFPLPNIDNCLEAVSGKEYYSSFDLASGYWQVEMEPKSREYTAFRTEEGHYQFVRMPFGLSNAPASFQRLMNMQFSGLTGLNLQIYLDDICIASNTWSEHIDMLTKFFQLIIENNLKLKPSKCVLVSKSITFLGHEISIEGIRQDREKVKALENLPRPKNVSELRRVIGLVSYYRKFVPNFALIASPLTTLLRKTSTFVWGDDQETAFVQIINELKQNAVLTHFNAVDSVALKTDASKQGIGGILLQKQHNQWKIVCCYSRRLSECETHYGVTELEGLAVVESMKKFRPYLLGRQFELIVDHCSLCLLRKRLSTSPRLRRWTLLLQEFDFKVIYKKGTLHADVDCLSRAPLQSDSNDFCLDEKVCTLFIPVDLDEWQNHYTDDESLQILSEADQNLNDLTLVNDIVYFKGKIFVPSSKRLDMLRAAHDSLRAGHRGIQVTAARLSDCWWPTKNIDIADYVRGCNECQSRKVERQRPIRGNEHFEAYQPFDLVCFDTLGPLPETLLGNKYVIVAVDVFSRFVEARAVADVKAQSCAEFILEFLARYGPPKAIRTDNGPQYLNDLVKDTIKSFGIIHTWTAPDHSEGNAPAERFIQTLQETLSLNCKTQSEKDNWDSILPISVLSLNSSICKSTGYTPYEMVFGRKVDILDNHISRMVSPKDLHTELIKTKLDQIYARAIENQAMSQNSSNRNFRGRLVDFEVGDLVMIRSPNRRKGKLDKRFLGPYRVIAKDKQLYTIEEVATGKQLMRHVESLKKYTQQNISNPSVNGLITTLTLFSLLISLIGYCNASIWQIEPPTLWGWVDKTVFGQVSYYDFIMVYKNPCDSLFAESHRYESTNLQTNFSTGATTTNVNLHESMVTRCNQIYEAVWESAVRETVANCKGRLDFNAASQMIGKRNIVTDVAVGAFLGSSFGPIGTVGGMVGALVTDLVGVAWEHLVPFTDNGQIRDVIKKVNEIILHREADLNAFKNITASTVRMLNSTLKIVNSNKNNLDQLITDLPEYIFAASAIMDYIQHHSRLLNIISNTCRSHVETLALSELLQLPILSTIPVKDAQWLNILRPHERALQFMFKVIEPSRDSHLVKVEPFEVWNLKKKPASLEKYVGPTFLLYNRTSACAKPIEPPASHIVMERCNTKNYFSEPLKKWDTTRTSNAVLKEPQITTVKNTGSRIYIYCFPGWIVINNRNISCSSHVVSIPSEVSFITSDYEYNPSLLNKSKTLDLDIRLGAHFVNSPLADERLLLEELEEMRDATRDIDFKPLDTLSSTGQWSLIGSILPIFLVLIVAIGYVKYQRLRDIQQLNVELQEFKKLKLQEKNNKITISVDNDSLTS